jgi:hypothetical protein
MSQRDGYPEGDAATLNDARQKPLVSRRRIEHLKALAYDCGLTPEEARKYGNIVAPGNSRQSHSINLLEWVNLSQLLAFSAATAGLIILLLNLWPRINPLNLFPQIKITIQVGTK